ncbi:MAG: thioesterase II family protein [Micromonosporaceae bacterium]
MSISLNEEITIGDWFVYPRPAPAAPVRLFCLPYAGGRASAYRSWPECLPDIEVAAIELPGRGSRFSHPPYQSMPDLVTALADAIGPQLTKPYAVFGHSLGARIGFELAREVRRRAMPGPVVLFVSGCRAPHIPRIPYPRMAGLSERAFARMLNQVGGAPLEVLDDPELFRVLRPALQADFTLADSYVYTDEPALPWPIRAFGGIVDSDAREDTLLAWLAHTSSSFRLRRFAGGHFVVHTRQREYTDAIAADLRLLGGTTQT